jgi:hypothetical protein
MKLHSEVVEYVDVLKCFSRALNLYTNCTDMSVEYLYLCENFVR